MRCKVCKKYYILPQYASRDNTLNETNCVRHLVCFSCQIFAKSLDAMLISFFDRANAKGLTVERFIENLLLNYKKIAEVDKIDKFEELIRHGG